MRNVKLIAREVEEKLFSDYYPFLTQEQRDEIQQLADELRGMRIVHINATSRGGGVAELLKSAIPLQRAVGLDSRWYVIRAPEEFFVVTKKIHNTLQGGTADLTPQEIETYLQANKELAQSFNELPDADLYVIHDPQPAALIAHTSKRPMVLRIHIDLSSPNKKTLNTLFPYITQYDSTVFSIEEFGIPELMKNSEYIIPAIDPLDEKNTIMDENARNTILHNFGINPAKPLMSQISRFDPWKDPVGVIEAYLQVKNVIPDAQLALVGIIEADDDPEQREFFEKARERAKGCEQIFLFSDPEEIKRVGNSMLVRAIQSASDVVIQKSIREGFGLTVTEAMWKKKAVVAGNVGGITKQIRDGVDGFLVNSIEEAANRTIQILRDPELKERLGMSAHKRVRDNFLMTRHLRDHLKLYITLLRG